MNFKVINRNYTALLIATIITRIGDSVGALAFSWMVYQLTGSRALMGLVFVVTVIPNVVVLPFSGLLADLMDKKKLVIISDILRGLGFIVIALLYMSGHIAVWHIFVVVVVDSVFESMGNPSRGGMLQSLVEEVDYMKASSFRSTASTIGELAGLAIAGVLISTVGITGAFIADGVSFFLSALVILTIHFVDKRGDVDEGKQDMRTYFTMIKEGYTYIRENRIIFSIILLAAFINFSFVPFSVLRPVFVDEVMKMGPEGLSYLGILFMVGVLISSIVVGKIGHKLKPMLAISTGLSLMALSYCLFGVIGIVLTNTTVIVVLAFVLSFFFGAFLPLAQSPISAIFMKETDPEMMGRASSIMGAVALCAMPLGGLLVSLVGDLLPVSYIFVGMGGLGIIVALLFGISHNKTKVSLVTE